MKSRSSRLKWATNECSWMIGPSWNTDGMGVLDGDGILMEEDKKGGL